MAGQADPERYLAWSQVYGPIRRRDAVNGCRI
jgi:hypothetical protein